MKTAISFILVGAAALSGCATRAPGPNGAPGPDDAMRSAISRALDKRVIECALPYMSTHNLPRADVRYHYQDGSVRFDTNAPGLKTRLGECATPETGPRARFERRLEIWPATAS